MKKHKEKEELEQSQENKPAEAESGQPAEAGQPSLSEADQLKQKLGEVENRNKELDDRLLRLAAEFDNYKKRTIREFENIIKNANQNLILDLINILNNFSRALKSSQNNQDLPGFKSGVELIYNQMKNLLNKEGLEEISAKGEKFDPALHEAVLQMESEVDEGTILDEVSKGYKLNGKVIRHSQVVVAKKKVVAEESNQENRISQEGKGE